MKIFRHSKLLLFILANIGQFQVIRAESKDEFDKRVDLYMNKKILLMLKEFDKKVDMEFDTVIVELNKCLINTSKEIIIMILKFIERNNKDEIYRNLMKMSNGQEIAKFYNKVMGESAIDIKKMLKEFVSKCSKMIVINETKLPEYKNSGESNVIIYGCAILSAVNFMSLIYLMVNK